MSEKVAKEMYEHALKLESDYRQYISGKLHFARHSGVFENQNHFLINKFLFLFSAVIPAGVNITHMSTQIKAAVDEEQNKALWVPITNP